MLKIKKISSIALLIGAILGTTACNEDKKTVVANEKSAVAVSQNDNLKDESYAMGVLFAQQMKEVLNDHKGLWSYNQDKLLLGIKDALEDKASLSNPELTATLKELSEKLSTARENKAKQENEKFIAEFKQKKDVHQTASGLLYRIEKMGEGNVIKPTDMVKVHYTGKLVDGTVFDSSEKHGQPVEFILDQVIPGWIEGLQLIKKGGKIELLIPAELGYGDQDLGTIPANSLLHFDVEILDVTPEK